MEISRGKKSGAQKIILYAPEGWGKSTLGSRMDGPVFIDTDKGICGDHIVRIDTNCGCAEMLGIVEELRKSPPPQMKTLVIDTMDKLIDCMTEDLCRVKKWETMEAQQYFKCWLEFKSRYFDPMLNGLKDVTRRHPITVLVLSHVKARKFEKPNGEGAWDRWETTFQYKELCASLKQASDLYVFGDFKDVVFEADKKQGEVKRHATGAGKRMAYCEHNGAYDAKCREFVKRADGSPFPKSCDIAEFEKCLKEAIANLSAGSVAVPTPIPEPEAAPAPAAAAAPANEHYAKLVSLVQQFGIDTDLLNSYVKTTKTFGPNPPPLKDANPKALEWLSTGIATGKLTNEFIKQKLNLN
jgi:hypothetical protein